MAFICPKNWADFQHYKDRSPVWIKLHRKILDDFDFHSLQVASKALAPLLWLLASEYEGGKIPLDSQRIAWRLRMTPAEFDKALKPLIDSGFFIMEQDASNTLATCLPREETETETETETEGEKDKAHASASASLSGLVALGVDKQVATDWLAIRKAKRAPLTQTALDGIKREADKAGISLADAIRVCVERGWQGFRADWYANRPAPATSGKPRTQPENFEQIDYTVGATPLDQIPSWMTDD